MLHPQTKKALRGMCGFAWVEWEQGWREAGVERREGRVQGETTGTGEDLGGEGET